jgi:hypothetical protein
MAQTLNSQTQSGNGSKPRNRAAGLSLVLGLLGVAAIPVAILVTHVRNDLRLLHAGVAVPVAFALGVAAVLLARKASRRLERTLGRAGGAGAAGAGRVLGWLGIYLALIGAISLVVYAVEYYLLS